MGTTLIVWAAVELSRNDNISIYCVDNFIDNWNRGDPHRYRLPSDSNNPDSYRVSDFGWPR